MRTMLIARVVAIFALVAFSGRAVAQQPSSYLTAGDLVIARVADSNEYLAYSKHGGVWKRHVFDDGITAIPVLDASICAFAQSGEDITELVAVDRQGNWRTVKLPSPAIECKPIVSNTVAVFNHAGRTYAFSSITGTWDSVPTVAVSLLEPDMVLMKSDDSIAVFSAQTGVWAETSLKSKTQ